MAFDFDKFIAEKGPLIKTLTGIDLEAIKAEIPVFKHKIMADIIAEIRPLIGEAAAGPVDLDALAVRLTPVVSKLVDEAEVRLANKIATAIDVLQAKIAAVDGKVANSAGVVDVSGIIESLKPIIVESSQEVCKATFKQLQAAIYQELDRRAASMQPGQPNETQGEGEGQNSATRGSASVKDMAAQAVAFFSTPVGEKVLDRLFPPPAAALGDPVAKLKAAYDVVKIIRGLGLDDAAADKLIGNLTSQPGAQPPIPPAKP